MFSVVEDGSILSKVSFLGLSINVFDPLAVFSSGILNSTTLLGDSGLPRAMLTTPDLF